MGYSQYLELMPNPRSICFLASLALLFFSHAGHSQFTPEEKAQITRLIQTEHYLMPDPNTIHFTDEASLNRYLSKLDPYSKYLSPVQRYYFDKRSTEYQTGLGLNLLVEGKRILAVPLRQGPAWKAGFHEPAYLHSANGQRIDPENFDSYRFLAELYPGAEIPLKIVKNHSHLKKYTIKAAPYHNSALEILTSINDERSIRIHRFEAGFSQKLKQAIQNLKKNNLPLILDLRYCPGGSLYEAVDSVSLFIPSGLPVAYLVSQGRKKRKLESLPGRIYDKQVTILMSEYTASSAEIFIQALKKYGTTYLKGSVTQGKCLSQKLFELKDGGALRLSVFTVLDAKGKNCEGQGIIPD